ncbi:tubulin polyglutamylase TTLL11 isoform X3 [Phycodurus eques]|uniref:tubulin polyglutamylase TTLL11 isoform X3 n=1 Tax=Phycodurus eques TaxID=693459 RepID=UPI002ACDFAB2|nr:tubulin polyglutamylase TTLL11 isoform X3 [Phycodurus eques]
MSDRHGGTEVVEGGGENHDECFVPLSPVLLDASGVPALECRNTGTEGVEVGKNLNQQQVPVKGTGKVVGGRWEENGNYSRGIHAPEDGGTLGKKRRPVTVDTSKAKTSLEGLKISIRQLKWREIPTGRRAPCDIYWHGVSFHDNENITSGQVNKFPDPHGEGERRDARPHVHRQARRRLSGRRHLPHPRPRRAEGGGRAGPAGRGAGVHPQTAAGGQAQVRHPPLRAAQVAGAAGDLHRQGGPDALLHRALPGAEPEEPGPRLHAPDQLLAQRAQRQLRALGKPEHGQQAHAVQRAPPAGRKGRGRQAALVGHHRAGHQDRRRRGASAQSLLPGRHPAGEARTLLLPDLRFRYPPDEEPEARPSGGQLQPQHADRARARGGAESIRMRSQSGGRGGESGRDQGHATPGGPRTQESVFKLQAEQQQLHHGVGGHPLHRHRAPLVRSLARLSGSGHGLTGLCGGLLLPGRSQVQVPDAPGAGGVPPGSVRGSAGVSDAGPRGAPLVELQSGGVPRGHGCPQAPGPRPTAWAALARGRTSAAPGFQPGLPQSQASLARGSR